MHHTRNKIAALQTQIYISKSLLELTRSKKELTVEEEHTELRQHTPMPGKAQYAICILQAINLYLYN